MEKVKLQHNWSGIWHKWIVIPMEFVRLENRNDTMINSYLPSPSTQLPSWFSLVSSTNKMDCHDITKILSRWLDYAFKHMKFSNLSYFFRLSVMSLQHETISSATIRFWKPNDGQCHINLYNKIPIWLKSDLSLIALTDM